MHEFSISNVPFVACHSERPGEEYFPSPSLCRLLRAMSKDMPVVPEDAVLVLAITSDGLVVPAAEFDDQRPLAADGVQVAAVSYRDRVSPAGPAQRQWFVSAAERDQTGSTVTTWVLGEDSQGLEPVAHLPAAGLVAGLLGNTVGQVAKTVANRLACEGGADADSLDDPFAAPVRCLIHALAESDCSDTAWAFGLEDRWRERGHTIDDAWDEIVGPLLDALEHAPSSGEVNLLPCDYPQTRPFLIQSLRDCLNDRIGDQRTAEILAPHNWENPRAPLAPSLRFLTFRLMPMPA